MGAARELLRAGIHVTILESGPRLGGNCVGVEVTDKAGGIHRIDAGVSDFNRSTFHEVSRLIDELGVPTQPIRNDADFVAGDGRSRLAWVEGQWIFSKEIADPEGLQGEIDAFRTRVVEVLQEARFAHWTVERYFQHIGASREFQDHYLLPRAMGCFPMPAGNPAQFSILALLRFWNVHGLVGLEPANRHCVVGGMHRYVEAYTDWFEGQGGALLCGNRVLAISRRARQVEIRTADRTQRARRRRFDHVILACHAHQALPLFEQPSLPERLVLSRFACQRARVVVHQDKRLLGESRETWGAFNYVIPKKGPASDRSWTQPTITFFPNRLGSLPAEVPETFVSMNPVREPRRDRVLCERSFLHPILDASSDELARQVESLQGKRRTWFAGAHLIPPAVHESALVSGMRAARRLLQREGESGAVWTRPGSMRGAVQRVEETVAA